MNGSIFEGFEQAYSGCPETDRSRAPARDLFVHIAVPRKMLVTIVSFEMHVVSASRIHIHLVENDTE